MSNLAHVLVCHDTKFFTFLNRYDDKRKKFQGEYSILHNLYEENSYFLNRFLAFHVGKELILMNSSHPDYPEVATKYQRFMEDDIPKYLEEQIQKEKDFRKDLDMDRNLGQLQLSILQKMVEEELKMVQNRGADTVDDHKVLLGKELGLQWVLHSLNDLVRRGSN